MTCCAKWRKMLGTLPSDAAVDGDGEVLSLFLLYLPGHETQ